MQAIELMEEDDASCDDTCFIQELMRRQESSELILFYSLIVWKQNEFETLHCCLIILSSAFDSEAAAAAARDRDTRGQSVFGVNVRYKAVQQQHSIIL